MNRSGTRGGVAHIFEYEFVSLGVSARGHPSAGPADTSQSLGSASRGDRIANGVGRK